MRVSSATPTIVLAPQRTAGLNTEATSRLQNLTETVSDTTGAYSVKDKAEAMSQLNEIRSKWIGDFTTPEAQLAEKAMTESAFAKNIEQVDHKYGQFLKSRYADTNKSTIPSIETQANLDYFESLSADDQYAFSTSHGSLSPDEFRTNLQIQKQLFKIVEDAEAKGTHDSRFPSATKDPKVSMALKLLESMKSGRDEMLAWTERSKAFLNQRSPVVDKVDLSPAAQAYLKDGLKSPG
jgi:hypothetical protein